MHIKALQDRIAELAKRSRWIILHYESGEKVKGQLLRIHGNSALLHIENIDDASITLSDGTSEQPETYWFKLADIQDVSSQLVGGLGFTPGKPPTSTQFDELAGMAGGPNGILLSETGDPKSDGTLETFNLPPVTDMAQLSIEDLMQDRDASRRDTAATSEDKPVVTDLSPEHKVEARRNSHAENLGVLCENISLRSRRHFTSRAATIRLRFPASEEGNDFCVGIVGARRQEAGYHAYFAIVIEPPHASFATLSRIARKSADSDMTLELSPSQIESIDPEVPFPS